MTAKTAEEILREIKNVEVDEYSTPCAFTVAPNATFDQVANMMKENGVRHIPVVENGLPVGMISDRDIRNLPAGISLLAKEIMSGHPPYTIHSGTLLREVVFDMSEKKLGSALVTGERVEDLMIFTSVDALNALNEILRGQLD